MCTRPGNSLQKFVPSSKTCERTDAHLPSEQKDANECGRSEDEFSHRVEASAATVCQSPPPVAISERCMPDHSSIAHCMPQSCPHLCPQCSVLFVFLMFVPNGAVSRCWTRLTCMQTMQMHGPYGPRHKGLTDKLGYR